MIKKLDRYLLRHFFSSLIVVLFSFGSTFVVINAIEELRDFIDHEVPIAQILEYYFYFSGWIVKSFLPMFILLAGLFSISILARRNEILAMKASGRSLYRIALPLLVVVAILAAGHFYYNEYIFPPWNKKRLEIKNFSIEQKSRTSFTNIDNIFRQIKPGYFYTLQSFNVDRREGIDLKIYLKENNRLKQITTAAQLNYHDYHWLATDGVTRTFDSTVNTTYTEFDSLIIEDIEEVPEDFKKKMGKPEDMGIEELKAYISLMKRTGGPYHREKIDLQLKYAYPMASFIVVLICIPLASNPRRGGIAVSIATGAIISLLYFVLFRIL
ncbi:MAG: LptF/LptG family permease, partial [bacterium]|nr:LptF/LptG family permease [bacterium]